MDRKDIMKFLESMIKQNVGNSYQELHGNISKFRDYLEDTKLVEKNVMIEIENLCNKITKYDLVSKQIRETQQALDGEEDITFILDTVDQKITTNLIASLDIDFTQSKKQEPIELKNTSLNEETVEVYDGLSYVKTYRQPTIHQTRRNDYVTEGCSGGGHHVSSRC